MFASTAKRCNKSGNVVDGHIKSITGGIQGVIGSLDLDWFGTQLIISVSRCSVFEGVTITRSRGHVLGFPGMYRDTNAGSY